MTIQSFDLYTANGYAGDLVDSAPAVKQTGVLTSASVGFGKAVSRDTSIDRGVSVGGTAQVFAITAREYNHEAGTRPSAGNDTYYLQSESVSLIREGYLYVLLGGAVAVTIGDVLHVDGVTGVFSKDAVAGDIVATTNVVAEESGLAGDVIKVRIDI